MRCTPPVFLFDFVCLFEVGLSGFGVGVWGVGFWGWGFGFGVWGLGFWVWGLGFGVWGLGFGVWGLGVGVGGVGIGVWVLGCGVWDIGCGVDRPAHCWGPSPCHTRSPTHSGVDCVGEREEGGGRGRGGRRMEEEGGGGVEKGVQTCALLGPQSLPHTVPHSFANLVSRRHPCTPHGHGEIAGSSTLQGYLAYKKAPPRGTLQYDHA